MTGYNMSCLELVPIRREKHVKPRPQNGILVSSSLFKIFDEYSRLFNMGVPQGGEGVHIC